MHGHDALDGGFLQGLDVGVGVVPAGDPTGGVGPDHVDLGAAFRGICILGKLVSCRSAKGIEAPPAYRGVEESVVYQAFGDGLFRRVLRRFHQFQNLRMVPHIDGLHVSAVKRAYGTDLL
jgi:hypothetical protein